MLRNSNPLGEILFGLDWTARCPALLSSSLPSTPPLTLFLLLPEPVPLPCHAFSCLMILDILFPGLSFQRKCVCLFKSFWEGTFQPSSCPTQLLTESPTLLSPCSYLPLSSPFSKMQPAFFLHINPIMALTFLKPSVAPLLVDLSEWKPPPDRPAQLCLVWPFTFSHLLTVLQPHWQPAVPQTLSRFLPYTHTSPCLENASTLSFAGPAACSVFFAQLQSCSIWGPFFPPLTESWPCYLPLIILRSFPS